MHESATQTAKNSDPTTTDRGVDCSSRFLLDQIADKWSVLILAALCKKPLRFNELKRCLDGITQKALTQALRRLERNGILGRRVIPSSQVAVEYSITPLGRTLEHPFSALYLWTLEHLDAVIKAQATFDSREIEAGQA
jgi:DNA-binding HxlR family transcriptional regulator